MGIALSVVIPAFNEEKRLPAFLGSVNDYLNEHFPGSAEILVVDDGSTDGTAAWVTKQSSTTRAVRLRRFTGNRGKGAAVREGVLSSLGDLVLFCDADGATPIAEEARLRAALDAGADVAVASRLVPSKETRASRPLLRQFTGRLFAIVAHWILPLPIRDTQCGFKIFRGEAGRRIASQATEDGYLFDLEWLCLARRQGLKIAEVPVNWVEMPGSKLRMGREAFRLLGALIRLRRRFLTGQNP